jgi:hypothetical protein
MIMPPTVRLPDEIKINFDPVLGTPKDANPSAPPVAVPPPPAATEPIAPAAEPQAVADQAKDNKTREVK